MAPASVGAEKSGALARKCAIVGLRYRLRHVSNFAELAVGEAKLVFARQIRGVKRLGTGLTSVMAAAIAKLMDVHELILPPGKTKRSGTARTTISLPGTLSSRLQPNQPSGDLSTVTLRDYTGPSLGAGRSRMTCITHGAAAVYLEGLENC